MDRRQREDLDRHITGNYGEDQFRDATSPVEPLMEEPRLPGLTDFPDPFWPHEFVNSQHIGYCKCGEWSSADVHVANRP